MTNIYRDLQVAVAAVLEGDEWLSSPPAARVITEELGDVATQIEKDLTGYGLTLVVVTPKVGRGNENDPGSRRVQVVVGVGERPRVNRGPTGTQREASDVACSIEALLGGVSVLAPWSPLVFIERTTDERTADMVALSLVFETTVRVSRVDEADLIS